MSTSNTPVSAQAAGARESARQDNGQFGTQHRAEADVELGGVADVYEHMSVEDRVALTRFFYRDAARNLDAYASAKANDFEDEDRADAHYKHGMAIAAGEAYIVASVPGAANITPPGAMGRKQCQELIEQGDGVRPSPHWKSGAITAVNERRTEAMDWHDAQQASNHMLFAAISNIPPSLDERDHMSDPEFDEAWTKQGLFNAAISHARALRDGSVDPDPDADRRLAEAVHTVVERFHDEPERDFHMIDVWDEYNGAITEDVEYEG